jgi:chlorite dismutase
MLTLRESEASRYTERDTPIFTCISMPVADALRSLGGVPAGLTAPA